MPTKQELETINDELLTENERLRRESAAQMQRLSELTATLQTTAARLEKLAAARSQQTLFGDRSKDEFAAQIEPLVTGLKNVIEAARQQTGEQNKRAQYLQTMLDKNERANEKFTNNIAETSHHIHRLGLYINELSGQPTVTLLKIAGAMFGSMILAGLMIVYYASWRLSPTRALIEDATKWQVLAEEMPAERVRQIEQQIENKLYNREQNGQIGAQTTGANPPAPTPAATPVPSPARPAASKRNRR